MTEDDGVIVHCVDCAKRVFSFQNNENTMVLTGFHGFDHGASLPETCQEAITLEKSTIS